MFKKYLKEIIITLSFLIGFACGWFGCKAYIRYKLNQAFESTAKEFTESIDSLDQEFVNAIVIDTNMVDTVPDCEF